MEKLKRYPNYKPSGVEWIGEIPEHWVVKPLKYLATCNDEVLAESTDPDTVIEYIEISDVAAGLGITGSTEMCFKDAPSRARRVVRQGDILVSTVRTYLKAVSQVKWNIENLVASTGFAVLRSNKVKSDLLGYVVTSRFIDEVTRRSTGVSYPAISSTELMNIAIPYAPSNEQETISSYLDEKTALIDETIAKKEQLIELLQEERTALINKAVTRGLDDSVPLKDPGVEWLGMIPEHWTIKRMKYIVTRSTKKAEGSGGFTIALENIISWEGTYQPTDSPVLSGELLEFSPEDVLFCKLRPYLAKVYLAESTGRCSSELLVLSGIELTPKFLFYRLLSSEFIEEVNSSTYGSKMPRASWEDFIAEMRIGFPAKSEQDKITSFLDLKLGEITTAASRIKQEISLLQEYRTALINEVVTGKRCVL